MKRHFISIFIGLIIAFSSLQGQHRFRTGPLPQVNLNKKFSGGWKCNLKLESRQIMYNGTFGKENELEYQYARTDLASVLSKKLAHNQSVAGGYMIRFGRDEIVHRLIQQYSLVQRLSSIRLGHRLRTDQTFASSAPTTFRIRYRLSMDRALNGESVDHREFYVKLSHEYLGIFQGEDADLEIRLHPSLGYAITDHNKIEAGLDYRLDSLVKGMPRSNFWINFSWYISI